MELATRKPGDGASDTEDLVSLSKQNNGHSYDDDDTDKPQATARTDSPDNMKPAMSDTRTQDSPDNMKPAMSDTRTQDSPDNMKPAMSDTRTQDSPVNFEEYLNHGNMDIETSISRSRQDSVSDLEENIESNASGRGSRANSINKTKFDVTDSMKSQSNGRCSRASSINSEKLDRKDSVKSEPTGHGPRHNSINSEKLERKDSVKSEPTDRGPRPNSINKKKLEREDSVKSEPTGRGFKGSFINDKATVSRSRSNSINIGIPDEEFDGRKTSIKNKSRDNVKKMRKHSNRSDDPEVEINENTENRHRRSNAQRKKDKIQTPEVKEVRKASPQEMWRKFKEEDEAFTRKMGLEEPSSPEPTETKTHLPDIKTRTCTFRRTPNRDRNFKSPTDANSRKTPISRSSSRPDVLDSRPNSRLSPNMEETPREERKIIKRTSPNLRQNESPFYGIEDPFRPSSRSQLMSDVERSNLPTGSMDQNVLPGSSPDPENAKCLVTVRSIGKCMRIKRYVKQKVKVVTPEEGYDTDLEIDTSEEYNSRQIEQRMAISRQNTDIGHHSYEEACTKFGTTALRRVVSQLWSSKMNLQHLGLNINEMRALSVALMHNARIEELDLDDNGLDGKCMTYVADLLKTNYFITKLSLSNNQIGEKGGAVLYETLQSNNWLTHLNLSGTQLRDDGVAFIANGLEENMTVKWINLSHNNIGVKGGLYIGRVLGTNYSLEHLDVSWNEIRLAGAVAVCKSIQKNKSLTTLNISWNGLGFEGSLAVGEALKSNKTLTTLDLCNNRINWECIPYIGRGLRVNKTLQVLELGLNPISMEGCDELLESISKNTCGLTHLGLENIPINSEVAFKATEVSKHRNFSLHHGGILSTRDMIGIQRAKKEDPLSLLIRYLSTMGIRVVDLFRMFETESKLYVSKANFISGLKRLRSPLDDGDIREILKKIYINKGGNISYQSLAAAVRNQLRDDRKEDMKEEKRERKRREERRRILRSDIPLIAPTQQVFFPNIFTFYGPKVIQRPLDDMGSPSMFNSRQSSHGYTPSSVPLPKLSVSSKNDYDSWRHSPQTLIGSLVYDLQRITPTSRLQTHSPYAKDDEAKQRVGKRSDS